MLPRVSPSAVTSAHRISHAWPLRHIDGGTVDHKGLHTYTACVPNDYNFPDRPDMAAESLSNHELDERIISAVRQFPGLYDPSSKDYRDVESAAAAWKQIGKICGKDWGGCKERWRKLRDAYVKVKKSVGKDGSRKNTTWPYYELMSFLAEHVKHRHDRHDRKSSKRSHNDMSTEDAAPEATVHIEYPDEDGEVHVLQEGNEAPGYTRRLVWPEESNISPKPRKLFRRADPVEAAILESLGQGSRSQADPLDDEEALFGKMVAATLRRFSPRAKALCKFKIQEIIFDLEEQNFSSTPP